MSYSETLLFNEIVVYRIRIGKRALAFVIWKDSIQYSELLFHILAQTLKMIFSFKLCLEFWFQKFT